MSKERLEGLLDRKAHIDERFFYYSRLYTIDSNYEALANLAIIAGRIDALIRQYHADNRRSRTVNGFRPNASS